MVDSSSLSTPEPCIIIVVMGESTMAGGRRLLNGRIVILSASSNLASPVRPYLETIQSLKVLLYSVNLLYLIRLEV